MIVWAESTAGASVVKTKPQPANKRLSALGVPFLSTIRPKARIDFSLSVSHMLW
jgi:hypothetical protein